MSIKGSTSKAPQRPGDTKRMAGPNGTAAPARRAQARLPLQIVLVSIAALCLPFLLYVALPRSGMQATSVVYLISVTVLGVTALLIWVEGLLALRPDQPPARAGSPYPAASAIIAAYLPNEALTVVETIEAFLRIGYAGPLQIILAYNTPRQLPIEAELRDLARRYPQFLPLRVNGSTSKAENVNAALDYVEGEFIGVFDADHHPEPGSFQRAWRWLSHGFGIVQGRSVIRNGAESWVARMVAVEFETIYGVGHPGRARLHRFGIFGGSNGYWTTEVLRQIRMQRSMLTEDIDSSMRALEAGVRIATDPGLISSELAPESLMPLVHQRLRWAQGWFQVTLKHTSRALRSPQLSVRQKLGVLHLLVWRELYPLLSVQVLPILAYRAWRLGGVDRVDWLLPFFLVTSLFTLSAGPGQTLLAFLVAVPAMRRQRGVVRLLSPARTVLLHATQELDRRRGRAEGGRARGGMEGHPPRAVCANPYTGIPSNVATWPCWQAGDFRRRRRVDTGGDGGRLQP